MRRRVIGKNLSFLKQRALVKEKGVVISSLQHRILFNFLEHTQTNIYPDGKGPWTYARTSTVTCDSQGHDQPSGCGAGDLSGLTIANLLFNDGVGVAVALPAEVHAIDP